MNALPRIMTTCSYALYGALISIMLHGAANAADNTDISFSEKYSIANVKIGMSKAEALAAIKSYNPGLVTFELLTGWGIGGQTTTRDKDLFKPEQLGFFSTITAVSKELVTSWTKRPITPRDRIWYSSKTEFGTATCGHIDKSSDAVVYNIGFSVDLVAPKVVYIQEQHAYCVKLPTSQQVITPLYKKYGQTPWASEGIRDDGVRILNEYANRRAFIEWRDKKDLDSFSVQNIIDRRAPRNGFSFGNEDAGNAIHVTIRTSMDPTYVLAIETTLFDDNAVQNYDLRQLTLVSELDRVGVTIEKLNDKELLKKVRVPSLSQKY